MRKKILFITAAGANQIPVMASLVQEFEALALRDPQPIEYVRASDLESMMSQINACPGEYFIILPAQAKSQKRRCVICAPGMSHSFSGDLHPASGVMVHTNIHWEDGQLVATAKQLLYWIKKLGQPGLSGYPWGKLPTRSARPHPRQKPSMCSHAHMPGGAPLKAERVYR